LEVFRALQLFDVYHSFWFRILISTLALNLIVCSLDRLPATLRVFRSVPKPDRKKPFEDALSDHRFHTGRPPAEPAHIAERLFRKSHRKTTRKESQSGVFLHGERGRFSLFAVYLVHLSVLLILAGSIVGSLLGFEAFVNIPEGESVDTVHLRDSRSPKPLGFRIECVDFDVSFYENGTPKEFRSELRFVGGENTEETTLRVNHPFTFQGIRFYQASYGSIPGKAVDLLVRQGKPPGAETGVKANLGERYPLPGGEGHFVVEDIRDDFMRMGMGPAVRIAVHPADGEGLEFWVFLHPERVASRFSESFKTFPKLNPSAFEPYTFLLEDVENRYYTGLQVNRDPGVPFVWAGFFLIVAGLFAAFFMSHRRVWIRIEDSGDGAVVRMAGRTNKNAVGAEREMTQLTSRLREHLGARGRTV
ncbi:MAG: cytochrome c biogenesis protein ResB, partial [Deltaproteobacteria bacterium]|nr:cytochrome c biogenesis protein ResB [Deltaproteobacteria bacterium]